MTDSQGRQGGVSALNTVQPLANTSCLNVNSPTSTASAPSQTSQGTTGSNTATVGVIAGSVVGGVILLALLIILGIWCIRKTSRQSRRKDDVYDVHLDFPSTYKTNRESYLPLMQYESQSHTVSPSSDAFMRHSRQTSYPDSFTGNSISPFTMQFSSQTASSKHPVVLAPPIHTANASPGTFASGDPSSSLPAQPSRLSSNVDGSFRYGGALDEQIAMVAGQAAPGLPAQIIVHTDLEDIPAPPHIIELPPQYIERQPLGSQESQPASRRNHKPLRS